jgi:hypothetical protein
MDEYGYGFTDTDIYGHTDAKGNPFETALGFICVICSSIAPCDCTYLVQPCSMAPRRPPIPAAGTLGLFPVPPTLINPVPGPAVIVSPTKKKRTKKKTLNNQDDLEAWESSDAAIIG